MHLWFIKIFKLNATNCIKRRHSNLSRQFCVEPKVIRHKPKTLSWTEKHKPKTWKEKSYRLESMKRGNKYTKYSDDSYRYDNSDGYHYKNSNGKFLSYCSFKMLLKSNLDSTFTRKGDRETYKPPNGNT